MKTHRSDYHEKNKQTNTDPEQEKRHGRRISQEPKKQKPGKKQPLIPEKIHKKRVKTNQNKKTT